MASTTRAAFHEMIEERGTDAVLLPGDLFHSRDLRPKILDQAEQELAQVPDDIPVLVSRGNHDENLTPREVTWLNYLHQRGHIVFLKAELSTNPETAQFKPYDPDDPGEYAGFYDIDVDEFDGPVRVFGLQWRGAKTGQALQQVANGIRATNEEYGDPAFTALLGHFGMEDEVPTLGGTVTHAELREVKEVVDYLALGHIHKRYEASDWIFNPGSPEAHNTREGRDDWEHGYYSVELHPDAGEGGGFEISHHKTKRRPYYRTEFDVTPYESPGELESAFREYIQNDRRAVEEYCQRPVYRANGEPRQPILDLRFTGTLQFSRGDFRTDELAAYAKETCNALYVQVNTGIRTANVQQLISEIDEEDVFEDGQLNTAALEDRVFETIAQESRYAEKASDVADVLGDAHQLAQADEAVEDIRDSVSSARRDLFPQFTDDVVLDIDEDPFEDSDIADDTSSDTGDDESGTVVDEAKEVVSK